MRITLSSSPIIANYLQTSSKACFMGLDVGSTNVGVAITDQTRVFVDPLKPIIRRGPERMASSEVARFSRCLNKIVTDKNIAAIVVGLPIYQNKLTPFCREIISFVQMIELEKDPLCVFWDESYTSADAASICGLQSKSKAKFLSDKDGISAALLLRNFFENFRE